MEPRPAAKPKTRQPTRRYHLSPEALAHQTRPLSLIQAGPQALEALGLHRGLTAWQLAKLLFLDRPSATGNPRGAAAAKSAVNHYCLRPMKANGWVAVKPLGYYAKGFVVHTDLQILTKTGADLLDELLAEAGVAYRSRWSREIARWQPIDPVHFLRVQDGLVALKAAARFAGLAVVEWYDDKLVKELKAEGVWTAAIEPDAVVVFDDGVQRYAVVVEVDCGTEPLDGQARNAWSKKIPRYGELYAGLRRDPFWRERPVPTVLTLSPRWEELLRVTATHGGRGTYWFAPFDVLERPSTLFAHRWAVPFVDGGASLSGKIAAERAA